MSIFSTQVEPSAVLSRPNAKPGFIRFNHFIKPVCYVRQNNVRAHFHFLYRTGLIHAPKSDGYLDFYWVYVFLDDNKVDHPDRFVEPVNNTIPPLTAEVQQVLKKSFLYTGDLVYLNIDVVCHVLDEQFKDSSIVFRPNMLKLQEALDAPLLEKPDTDPDFIELRNKYRFAIKNWLDSNTH